MKYAATIISSAQIPRDAVFLYALFIASIVICFSQTALSDTRTNPTVLGPDVTNVEIKPDADFSQKKLSGSVFNDVDLSSANFDLADLRGATFIDCDLSNASFRYTSFSGSQFMDCKISNANFSGAIISHISDAGGESHARFYLNAKQLASTKSFQTRNLRGYALHRRMLGENTDLSGFDLREVTFVGGDFRDVDFQDAQISGARSYATIDFDQWRETSEVRNGRFPAHFYARNDTDLSGLDLRGA